MNPTWLLTLYCGAVVLASLAGGWVPTVLRLTHRRMQLAVSLIAGFMLAVGLMLMLPHALLEAPSVNAALLAVLAGFVVMFFIERGFSHHHHEVPEAGHAPADHHHHPGPHNDAHQATSGTHATIAPRPLRLSWGGAAVGLTLHSILDGMALAAAVSAGLHVHDGASLASLAIFLVVFLHRPFDSMTLVALMAAGGWSTRARHLANGLFALAIPAGALAFHLGLAATPREQQLIALALAFSAGTFLCIAGSDLLPELQFHQHDRLPLSLAFIIGLALALAVAAFDTHQHEHTLGGQDGHLHPHEPDHDHDPAAPPPPGPPAIITRP